MPVDSPELQTGHFVARTIVETETTIEKSVTVTQSGPDADGLRTETTHTKKTIKRRKEINEGPKSPRLRTSATTATCTPSKISSSGQGTPRLRSNVMNRPSIPQRSTHSRPMYPPNVPHPASIKGPPEGETVKKFYVVIVGQEVGIFFDWLDAAQRVNHVHGAIYKSFHTFQEAIERYTRAFERGEVRAIPIPGGPFWVEEAVCDTVDEEDHWRDDLTDQLSNVHIST